MTADARYLCVSWVSCYSKLVGLQRRTFDQYAFTGKVRFRKMLSVTLIFELMTFQRSSCVPTGIEYPIVISFIKICSCISEIGETERSTTAEIARVGGYYAVDGHSRSPNSVTYQLYSLNNNLHRTSYLVPLQSYCVLLVRHSLSTMRAVRTRSEWFPALTTAEIGVRKVETLLYRSV